MPSHQKQSSLSEFPNFVELSLAHKDALEAITDSFASYSDFNFASLFSWDTEGKIAVCMLKENLVVRFTDYMSNEVFLSFLGTNDIEATIKRLLSYSIDAGHKAHLSLVPEAVINSLPESLRTQLNISEDRDNHDYILSVDDLVAFATNKYRGKKNLYNRFMRTYGENVRTAELDLAAPEIKKQLLRILDEWRDARQKTDAETRTEFIAIKRCLEHYSSLGVRAYGTYLKGNLIAFTLFEINKNNEAIIHFDKANIEYVGVFEHLKHNFAKYLSSLGVEAINYEQDLGLPGLRQAKESYHPVKFLKKYTVSQKT